MLSNIDFGSYFHTKKYEKGLSTGGDKIADWGGSKGGWGGHVPPSLYVKRGPARGCTVAHNLHFDFEFNIHAVAAPRGRLGRTRPPPPSSLQGQFSNLSKSVEKNGGGVRL